MRLQAIASYLENSLILGEPFFFTPHLSDTILAMEYDFQESQFAMLNSLCNEYQFSVTTKTNVLHLSSGQRLLCFCGVLIIINSIQECVFRHNNLLLFDCIHLLSHENSATLKTRLTELSFRTVSAVDCDGNIIAIKAVQS